MRKALRWLGWGLGGIAALLLIGAGVVFVLSEIALSKDHRAASERLVAPTSAQLADAPRQARILGCTGCHGEGLEGRMMIDSPVFARIFAPAVAPIAAKASDQQLAAAIRQGIGHDGRGLFIMASPMYSRLGDAEVAALIAWMRSLPRSAQAQQVKTVRLGPFGRLGLATGRFRSAPELVEDFRRQVPIDLGPSHAAGRRIAATVCSECHGAALMGQEMPSGTLAPDLAVVGGYDAAQFKALLRTGRPPSGKKLGLMEEVAVYNLKHLDDAEIEALYLYLEARSKRLGS